ncbi:MULTISPECIES: DUF3237 family protein [unclassified Streptomyces]|uniref:DUF3237 family protein n=1 Tax=unclassified Streptomyces TaxID=2593676 RepID=UPI00381CD4D3
MPNTSDPRTAADQPPPEPPHTAHDTGTTEAAGAPGPRLVRELVARLTVFVGEPIVVGRTPRGLRRVIPLTGGTVTGPRVHGEVLPLGADWSLIREDGVPTVDATYLVRTDDGVVLSVTNSGALTDHGFVTTPRIEAPEGPYAWLNDAVLVGTLTPLTGADTPSGVSLAFHRVTEHRAPEGRPEK